jgi:hypothetical protein
MNNPDSKNASSIVFSIFGGISGSIIAIYCRASQVRIVGCHTVG